MRTAIALLLACLLAHAGRAQDEYLTIWGGAVASRLNLPSFDEFRTSFNLVNEGFSEDELSSFGLSWGWQAGGIVMLTEHIGISLCYMKQQAGTEATFTDGSARHLRHELYTPINGGVYVLAGPIGIHPRLGFCHAELHSWTEYSDGTMSYSNERLLNGEFRTFGLFAGLDLGARIKLGEAFSLAIGGTWFGVSGSDYSEPNIARSVDIEPFYPSSLPTDWDLWLDLSEANELTEYDVNDYVMLKGSWYGAYLNLMLDLK
jgi:hypothetical protein